MEKPHFAIHNKSDTCAVALVENIKKGSDCLIWNMENDETSRLKPLSDIPIGHKISLMDIPAETTVIKYGQDIGKTVSPVKKGEHLHVHNMKTKRW